MRLVALRAIGVIASALAAPPALADDAPLKGGAMSRGWECGEQGGADLFRNVCAGCHQPDAKGAAGAGAYPPLAADTKLASTDYLLAVLMKVMVRCWATSRKSALRKWLSR